MTLKVSLALSLSLSLCLSLSLSLSPALEMARTWLINSRAIAKKVKNTARYSAHQVKDYGAERECPNCSYHIDNSDVTLEWPGLPAGVKFDPSDVELLDHLAAKCGMGNSKPHVFIEEFIPTLDVDGGICYTHPAKLPGAKKDGSSIHFFHKTVNAYATGQRKRRKVQNEHNSNEEHVRWHKTGKTKCVIDNGVQKGCKKIMVLYKKSKQGSKSDKSNWVMHQYHLGTDEDEKEGEYVVSKILYQQPKQTDKNDDSPNIEESETLALQTSPRTPNANRSPRTPNPNPPNPPRTGNYVLCDDADDSIMQSSAQGQKNVEEAVEVPSAVVQLADGAGYPEWLAGESQAAENSDLDCIEDSLLCKEIFHSSSLFTDNFGLSNLSYPGITPNANQVHGNNSAPCGISDLENLDLDTPPDFQLADLQFGSQDSILDWIDRL